MSEYMFQEILGSGNACCAKRPYDDDDDDDDDEEIIYHCKKSDRRGKKGIDEVFRWSALFWNRWVPLCSNGDFDAVA